MNVEIGHLDMFKFCQILSSHFANKQIVFRYATVPTATQITMN